VRQLRKSLIMGMFMAQEVTNTRVPLKMRFFRDYFVSFVLESSCMPYTLRFSARCLLVLTKKSLFLAAPLLKARFFNG